MDQALFDTFVVGVYAIAGTVFVALVRRRRFSRYARFCVATIAVLVIGSPALAAALGFRLNVTGSMPVGIYRTAARPQQFKRGMLVEACAPRGAGRFGMSRDYISAGPCPDGSEPLLKRVVAVAGDTVGESDQGVVVGRALLANSKPLHQDLAGRPLRPWRFGSIMLPRCTIWLQSESARGWDSRYWGPVQTQNVLAVVTPTLVVVAR